MYIDSQPTDQSKWWYYNDKIVKSKYVLITDA